MQASRILTACIVTTVLFGCNPNDDIPGEGEDPLLGEPFYGSIILFANSAVASDFHLACDGRNVNESNYSILFTVAGNTYGTERYVDSDRQFALPGLSAPTQGTGYYICYLGVYPNRTYPGDDYISNRCGNWFHFSSKRIPKVSSSSNMGS